MGSYTSADLIPLIYAHLAFIVVPGVITGVYTWWTGWRDDENQVYSNVIDVDFAGATADQKAA